MEEGHNAKKSPFRCLLAAARYAAASMVTVLILIVIVKAIKVLLQPGSLSVSVSRGCIYVEQMQSEEPKIRVNLYLRLVNPRSDVRMHFYDISACLFGKSYIPASTPCPPPDWLMFFELTDTNVSQHQVETSYNKIEEVGRSDSDVIKPSFFNTLYRNASLTSDMTMRIEGTLTQVISTSKNYTRRTTYYCWPLVIVGEDLYRTLDDIFISSLENVFCREEEGKKLI